MMHWFNVSSPGCVEHGLCQELLRTEEKEGKYTDAMKLSHLLVLTVTTTDALDTLGTELPCEDPLLGANSKRLNENDGFPDQGTVMYVCDPEYFGQSGSYTTIKVCGWSLNFDLK